jgi:hypothetical protein
MLPLLTDTTGKACTVTVLTASLLQPVVLMPVTVYVVVFPGFTVAPPELNEYESAPDGVIVNDCPLHMVPLFTETVGVISTVTEDTACEAAIQPTELVPETE